MNTADPKRTAGYEQLEVREALVNHRPGFNALYAFRNPSKTLIASRSVMIYTASFSRSDAVSISSATDHSRSVTPAAIAGVARSVR